MRMQLRVLAVRPVGGLLNVSNVRCAPAVKLYSAARHLTPCRGRRCSSGVLWLVWRARLEGSTRQRPLSSTIYVTMPGTGAVHARASMGPATMITAGWVGAILCAMRAP